jgi:branched-chain amino acid transport system substrate-binding protein
MTSRRYSIDETALLKRTAYVRGKIIPAQKGCHCMKMTKVFRFFITGCVLLIMNLPSAAFPSNAQDSVKLALILAKTGIAAQDDTAAIDAARLAIEEINTRGGLLGHTVELLILDNVSTPIGAKMAAEKAVKLGVIGIIGSFRSSHSLAMVPVVQKAKIPMITPSSTNPDVTLGKEYVFRACFIDSFQGLIMAEYAYKYLHARKAVILTNANEIYSITLAQYFKSSFTMKGGNVLAEEQYPGTAVDFTKILSRVKQLRPDVLFIPGYSRDSGLLINQAVKMGIVAVFLGGDAWDVGISQYAGKAIEGAYQSNHWHSDVPFERNLHLKTAYLKKYGLKIIENMRIPLTYDSVYLFADAAKRAGSLNPEKIRDALSRTRDFKGATGTITFDQNRNPIGKEACILRFNNGSWTYLKSIRQE